MNMCPLRIDSRERQILAGLFLSKFDAAGLAALGFGSFTEAFNVLGYGLGGRPASIKNYRDEFDPIFPNPRQGWKNRSRREYCVQVEEKYRALSMDDFAALVKSLLGDSTISSPEKGTETDSSSSFAKRLITGRAAEKYFQSRWKEVGEFSSLEIEDTTSQGCGYDFRLWPTDGGDFRAVEVKGMAEQSGMISMTDKEYAMAGQLGDRFYLFVVKNFREKPYHEIHRGPLAEQFGFRRFERRVIQISWSAAM